MLYNARIQSEIAKIYSGIFDIVFITCMFNGLYPYDLFIKNKN